jgi:hypothetical protein
MRRTIANLLRVCLMSLVSIASTGTAAAQSANRTGESNLIVIARESSRPGKLPVLDLIRQRLPVGVHSGSLEELVVV